MDQNEVIADLRRRIQRLETQKLGQQQIAPNAIHQSHIFGGFIVFRGLEKDKPANGSTEVQYYHATDTNKLYAWNGSSWKSTTLS